MDYVEKLGKIEQDLYNKYPHLQPQQTQQPVQQQYQPTQQEQQQHFNNQVEREKQRVCDILIDWNNKRYERLSVTFVIDSLSEILKYPLHAQDQIYYKEQLRLIESSLNPKQEQTPANFKSAEELVNNSNKHNKNGNNKNKDSQNNNNMV